MTTRSVFVIGLHDHHRDQLEHLAGRLDVAVQPLLSYDDVRGAPTYDIDALLETAEDQLDRFDGSIDAITTYWDFPSTSLAAILCERRGLATPGLRAVVACEHKYWSRLVQADVAPDDTPAFEAVDPAGTEAADELGLQPPFWIKPVKSYSGHLGFRIEDRADLDRALDELRRRIGRLGEPFQNVVDRVDDVPEEVEVVTGSSAVAEELLDGHQCTLEGHVHDGEVRVHGLFDIERAADGSTFTRYTYPSRLGDRDRARMHDVAAELMQRIGYDHAPFNIEFFVTDERTWILEINARISQEHTDLMGWVDGSTNLEVMLRTALGEEPQLDSGSGEHAIAGKKFVRHAGDAHVERIPHREELAAIEARFAPCRIHVEVPQGARLSELEDQEPSSTILAYVYAAAEDATALDRKLEQAAAKLPFELTDVEPTDGAAGS